MVLTYGIAESSTARDEVQQFLSKNVGFDIAPNAIPRPEHDATYAPLVAGARDDEELVGAALSCRAQVCVTAAMLRYRSPFGDYTVAKDRHSELDLMAVTPRVRSKGVGSELIRLLERDLRSRGVRFWFGNMTDDSDLRALIRFYERNGFTVLAKGEPIPSFMGLTWTLPNAPVPERYFWKKLEGRAG